MNVQDYLASSGYSTIDSSFYEYIDNWFQWYQGKVQNFHKYTVGIETQKLEKERYCLGMAKKAAQDWADLLMNEKVIITSAEFDLDTILERNNFHIKANHLVELAYALGTGAFVESKDPEGGVVIDYIRADMIYPLAWKNGIITECAFGKYKNVNEKKSISLQIHVMETGAYVIKNRLIDMETGLEINEDGLEREIATESKKPLFQIVRPNIVNHEDLDFPMGISIYANAIDQLKGIDLVYDSYCNEFELGKKRIIVPASMTKAVISQNGKSQPVFDSCSTTFYAGGAGLKEEQKPQEINMDIRVLEHDKGLERQLSLLSLKCGFGNARYSFQSGTEKSAAEDLSRNFKKHETALKSALIDMAKVAAFLSGHENAEINISFESGID